MVTVEYKLMYSNRCLKCQLFKDNLSLLLATNINHSDGGRCFIFVGEGVGRSQKYRGAGAWHSDRPSKFERVK